MFTSVLIANRGEIAVRITRTLHARGLRAVAVYTDPDAGAPHVGAADVAVRVPDYLDGAAILAAGAAVGADAVHPGYGFLAENAGFARQVGEAGMTWIGPPPEAIEAMGDKIRAKATVGPAGVPLVPGSDGTGLDDAAVAAAAREVGFPVLLKPSAGGGGKGMHVVERDDELESAIAAARREARSSFGDDTLLVERYVTDPRHVEIQVLADRHGGVVHLGERECSLQRRHQKVVEEAPSAVLDETQRLEMGKAAVEAARACGYVGAGTVEFVTNSDASEFFFLEMNTRLQVEHPVTEEVVRVRGAGLDLVAEQLRVAAGEPLGYGQDDVTLEGHAVEVRLYAEDPARGFLPTGGTVLDLVWPPHTRVDAGVEIGTEVGSRYDPMLAKIIASGPDRAAALDRLDAALAATTVLGVRTNLAWLRTLLNDEDVRAGPSRHRAHRPPRPARRRHPRRRPRRRGARRPARPARRRRPVRPPGRVAPRRRPRAGAVASRPRRGGERRPRRRRRGRPAGPRERDDRRGRSPTEEPRPGDTAPPSSSPSTAPPAATAPRSPAGCAGSRATATPGPCASRNACGPPAPPPGDRTVR